MVIAAHIDDNVLGGDQAQGEVNNLFDENNEEEEINKIADDSIENNEEETERIPP